MSFSTSGSRSYSLTTRFLFSPFARGAIGRFPFFEVDVQVVDVASVRHLGIVDDVDDVTGTRRARHRGAGGPVLADLLNGPRQLVDGILPGVGLDGDDDLVGPVRHRPHPSLGLTIASPAGPSSTS